MVCKYRIYGGLLPIRQTTSAWSAEGLTKKSTIIAPREQRAYDVPLYTCNGLFYFECRG